MAYWTFTDHYLYYINFTWKDYYDERMWALDSIYRSSEEFYRNEGNEDIRMSRYTRDSVQKWYDNKMYELKRWYNKCVEELKRDHQKFLELYEQMKKDKFDYRDFHYEIVYDFRNFTRTVNYSSTLDQYHFRVRMLGTAIAYSCCGRREDCTFKPDGPHFDKYE